MLHERRKKGHYDSPRPVNPAGPSLPSRPSLPGKPEEQPKGDNAESDKSFSDAPIKW